MTELFACYFGSGRFESMARALGASITANAPEVAASIVKIEAPERKDGFASNSAKLAEWRKQVDALADGEKLILLDADTLVLKPLAPAFDAFETPIGLTSKGQHLTRMRYNCGVVFVRGGADARAFFARWTAIDAGFLKDRSAHAPYEAKHGGINQAAWGYMRDNVDPLVKLVTDLPCDVWNACYPPLWANAVERAAIVHYKSDLRAAVMFNSQRHPQLVNLWKHYERLSQ